MHIPADVTSLVGGVGLGAIVLWAVTLEVAGLAADVACARPAMRKPRVKRMVSS